MTSRDFAYWLQGFFELSNSKTLSDEQVDLVKKHLEMVFRHEIDPSFGKDLSDLQKIHEGTSPFVPYKPSDFPRINC